MAGFFGRGTSSNNNSTSHNNNNNTSSGYDSSPVQQTTSISGGNSGSGGGNADYGSTQSSYGTGGGGTAGNGNGGGGGGARSEASGFTASTGSRFGSINNDEAERASISTFGGGTSIASSNVNQRDDFPPLGKQQDRGYGQQESQQQQSSGGYGQQQGQQQGQNHPQQGNNQQSSYGGGNQQSSYGGGGQQQQQQQQSYGGSQQVSSYGQQSQSPHDNMSSSNAERSGTMGTNNASSLEMTDESALQQHGQGGGDPIAIAADFNSDSAEIVFLSSESGRGASRQPVTKFRIHEVNLNVHSAVLSEMVDTEDDDDPNTPRPEVVLEEDAATLKLLFGLMYNRPAPPLTMSDWQVVLRMARAAQKYDCARAKEIAAAYFTEQEQLGALSPFMAFAVSVQYKLHALEEAAAERSVRYDLFKLPPIIFDLIGFQNFQKLSAFHAKRQAFYQDVLNNLAIDPKELSDQCYQTGGVCAVGPWQRLKKRLTWPRSTGRDGGKRPPEPNDCLKYLAIELSQIDCGSCARALAEAALAVQTALTSLPGYREEEEDAF